MPRISRLFRSSTLFGSLTLLVPALACPRRRTTRHHICCLHVSSSPAINPLACCHACPPLHPARCFDHCTAASDLVLATADVTAPQLGGAFRSVRSPMPSCIALHSRARRHTSPAARRRQGAGRCRRFVPPKLQLVTGRRVGQLAVATEQAQKQQRYCREGAGSRGKKQEWHGRRAVHMHWGWCAVRG